MDFQKSVCTLIQSAHSLKKCQSGTALFAVFAAGVDLA